MCIICVIHMQYICVVSWFIFCNTFVNAYVIHALHMKFRCITTCVIQMYILQMYNMCNKYVADTCVIQMYILQMYNMCNKYVYSTDV